MYNKLANSLLGNFNVDEYQKNTFKFLKQSENSYDAMMKSICYETEKCILVPLGTADLNNLTLMQTLSDWRNKYLGSYQDQTPSTVESTTKWFQDQILNNNNRILFLIFGKSALAIGHIGLNLNSGFVEVDNVMRGLNEDPGILSSAMRVLESWCYENFNLDYLRLRVIKSNYKALSFYNKLGWIEIFEEQIEIVTRNESSTESVKLNIDAYVTMEKKCKLVKPKDVTMILTAGPSVTSAENLLTANATRFGWNAHHSDYITEFEKRFADYIGSKYAITTSSGTASLHLSLMALGIGPGDEVIVPNITWVATASAVTYVGAKPIFADVDSDSWGLCSKSVRRLITKKTKAIVPVHLYGFATRMPQILELAREFNLAVIEDAAPAIGTLLNGKAAGTFGNVGCFSFQGAKMLVTGEGGMVVTDSEEIYLRIKKIQDHGRIPGSFWIDKIGHKYKMANIVAAFGIGQLTSVERQIQKKRKINEWYLAELSEVKDIKFQFEIENSRSICWMSSIVIENYDRDKIFQYFKKSNIDIRPAFPVISGYPIWGNDVISESTNATNIALYGMNLPSGVTLSRDEIRYVSAVLKSAII